MRKSLRLKLASALFFTALAFGPAAEPALAQGPPEEIAYFNEWRGRGLPVPHPHRRERQGEGHLLARRPPGCRLARIESHLHEP